MRWFTQSGLRVFTSLLVASAFLMSFLILLNWRNIRDNIGNHYAQGYFATQDGPVYAEHWYAEHAMWLLEVVLMVGTVAFPIITVTLTRKAIDYQRCLQECYGTRSNAKGKSSNPNPTTP
jgi:hypothetical protein